ncbi:hypothetical protein D3C71_1637190 [compost metagenome]
MLTQIRSDEAWNEDGSIRCARTNPQFPSRAECTWQKDGTSSWGYMFQEPGNRSMYVLQVRDRHGNLTGLGDIPLD